MSKFRKKPEAFNRMFFICNHYGQYIKSFDVNKESEELSNVSNIPLIYAWDIRCALTRRLNFSMSSLVLPFNFRQSPCLIIMVKYYNQSSIDFETEGDGHAKYWNIADLWNGFHLKIRVVYRNYICKFGRSKI